MGNGAFDGRVAVVTGAGSGLGRSHASELARLGATVVINDVRQVPDPTVDGATTAAAVAAELQAHGWNAWADAGDLSDETYARALIERTVERHHRIDILVNNAGTVGPGSIYEATTADLRRTFDINYWTAVSTMQAAMPIMREQGYGRVINTASGVGAFGAASRIGYVSSKAAVIGLTKAAALDAEGTGTKVNAICPIAYTPMSRDTLAQSTDVSRDMLDVRAVSPVVLYLAHTDCTLNGEVLSAGMGIWARIVTVKTRGIDTTSTELSDVFTHLESILDPAELRVLRSSRDQFTVQART